MLSNRLAFIALGVACIAAAAGGGYLATRQNAVPAAVAAQPVASEGAPAAATPSVTPVPDKPVQETEAVVGDSSKPPATVSPTPAISSSPKRVEPAGAARPARTSSVPAASRSPQRTAATHQEPPPLSSTWPASASTQAPVPAPAAATATPTETGANRSDDRTAQEPARAPEPPQKTFEELVVSADSVIGLQIENRVSSDTARVEDRVDAKVTRDVKVGDRVAIPAGSRVTGTVTQVDRGGKFKERARLGIRFNMLVLADGTRVPISTETIYRDGEAPGNSSAAKVGGAAVGGAILGAILGGGKGAAIGGTVGAAGGTAAVMAGDRSTVVLTPGTPMTVRVLSPVTITTEKE